MFPLNKKVFITDNSDSFKNRDLSKETEIPIGTHCGAFGVKRRFDTHTGIDLYCQDGDDVFAIEDGIVVLIEDFTGASANSEWWNNTQAVHIEGESGVIVYGEIEPNEELSEGLIVKSGQEIGKVRQVLKQDKGRPMSMLHIELYKHGSRQSCIWENDKAQNDCLLDPTELLISLKEKK